MAKDINSITITGRLGRDAELRGDSGSILSMRVANNVSAKEGGEWVEKTNWLDAVMFGARAHAVAPYLKKGTEVAISGELRIREYEARDGGKRIAVEIVVDELKLLGGFPKPEAQPVSVYSDEIPF